MKGLIALLSTYLNNPLRVLSFLVARAIRSNSMVDSSAMHLSRLLPVISGGMDSAVRRMLSTISSSPPLEAASRRIDWSGAEAVRAGNEW